MRPLESKAARVLEVWGAWRIEGIYCVHGMGFLLTVPGVTQVHSQPQIPLDTATS